MPAVPLGAVVRAGATDSVAGQILKAPGVRVIGIAGREEKVRWEKEKAGFDGKKFGKQLLKIADPPLPAE